VKAGVKDPVGFAQEVREALKLLSNPGSGSGRPAPQAISLAQTLLHIQSVMADRMDMPQSDPQDTKAYELILSLATGTSHSIWEYVQGRLDEGRPGPNAAERMRRASVMVLVEIAQEKLHRRQRPFKAVQRQLESAGILISVDVLKGWFSRADELQKEMRDAVRATVYTRSEEFQVPPIEVAERLVVEFFRHHQAKNHA
jgi:hypothetical protein